jgi:RimJ/RimL family protein N-acetyltransferase
MTLPTFSTPSAEPSSEWVIDDDARIVAWVRAQGGGHAWPGSYTALALQDASGIGAGLVFYDFNGTQAMVNIAITRPEFFRKLLHLGLLYAFHQLALHRLTFLVSSSNLPSIALCSRMGATHEATLREAGTEKEDLHIYALFPEACPYWRKLRGKISRIAAGRC